MRVAAGSVANLKPELVIQACLKEQGKELSEFALLIHRDEVYANCGAEGSPIFRPLEDLGEDIE